MITEEGRLIRGTIGEYSITEDEKKIILDQNGNTKVIPVISFSPKEMVLFDDDKLIKVK